MNKVGMEYLPDRDGERYQELRQQFIAKQLALLKAEQEGQHELADQLMKEKDHLLTELRMINPGIDLTAGEFMLQADADLETKLLHDSLNNKSKID